MNSKGRITVFLCLIVSGMVLLGITAINVIGIFAAKEKAAIAVRSSVSGVKAGYNSYIFEHYHILLFDKSCGGMGEAMLEEQIIADLEYNLGNRFDVRDVAVKEYTLLHENNCMELKEQIKDYMKYEAVKYGADTILKSTGGQDGAIPDEVFEEMDSVTEGGDLKMGEAPASERTPAEDEAVDETEGHSDGDSSSESDGTSIFVDDPRDFTEDMSGSVLLSLVVPENILVNSEIVNLSEVPSLKYLGLMGVVYQAHDGFDDYGALKSDLKQHDSWKDSLVAAGAGAAYAGAVFNCATNQEMNSDAVFGCEMEYLIAGKDSDKGNLESVIRRLLLIRLPVNYTYLISDTEKMSQIRAVSVPLSIIVMTPEPILTYLIAGCWAYAEGMADVRSLLEGKKMPFIKDKEGWVTDLNNLEDSVDYKGKEAADGLRYEDYLMILMAFDMDKVYYRMLDIMELNVRQHEPQFQIEQAAVYLSVDIDVSYGERIFRFRESGGY